jgi:hypothetical protein
VKSSCVATLNQACDDVQQGRSPELCLTLHVLACLGGAPPTLSQFTSISFTVSFAMMYVCCRARW